MGTPNQKKDTMKLQIYSIYDEKGKFFSSPYYSNNNDVAIRQFKSLVNDDQSTVSIYPADFTLFHIGTFDDSNAIITPRQTSRSLGNGLQYIDTQNPITPVNESNKPKT